MPTAEHNLATALTGDPVGEFAVRVSPGAAGARMRRPTTGELTAMSRHDVRAMRIEAHATSVREDHRCRTDYLIPTKRAAAAVGLSPNKFGDRYRRTRDWLVQVATACPAETAAEMMAILAKASAERERLISNHASVSNHARREESESP